MHRILLLALTLAATPPTFADVPVNGRAQSMRFSRAQMQTVAAEAYDQTLARLSAHGALDTDPKTLRRVRRICNRLVGQALILKPMASAWPWEVHITTSPQIAAYSMAGGKLLVSRRFIDNYRLSDDELAVALAHEITHVIAEHVREQVSLAASFAVPVPGRQSQIRDVIEAMNSDIRIYLGLQSLSQLQELEADDIGIELAARSGVAPTAIRSFYRKITSGATEQSLFDTHGSSSQRWAFVNSMAAYAGLEHEASRRGRPPRHLSR